MPFRPQGKGLFPESLCELAGGGENVPFTYTLRSRFIGNAETRQE